MEVEPRKLGGLTRQARRAEFEILVAHALRHLDAYTLMESPLTELSVVQQRASGDRRYFAEGEHLRGCLVEATRLSVSRLGETGRERRIKDALLGVLQGKSIARLSREARPPLSREWFSKSVWKLGVRLVADELLTLDGAASEVR